MKTTIAMLAILFSMLETQPLLAQVAKSVSFQIMNVPTKQGKVLLSTENNKHYGMTEATDSTVKIKLNDIPYGRYKIYVYHDANGNWQLDKSANNTPIEHCAIHEIDITADNQTFNIELVDIQKRSQKENNPPK